LSGPDGQAMAIHTRIDDMLMRYSPKHPVHRAVTRSRGYLEASALRADARSSQPM
jgi:hypothetical protein